MQSPRPMALPLGANFLGGVLQQTTPPDDLHRMGFVVVILTIVLLHGIPANHRFNATTLGVTRHWECHIVWLPILLCALASAVQAVLNDLLLHLGSRGNMRIRRDLASHLF